jgi:predicted NBD/HSP70 family sugar kinase
MKSPIDTPNAVAPATVDTARMRELNSTLLLNLIWRERRISRADLARRTGLSRSTVSAIVSDLLATGLVRESGAGDSSGGRPPTILDFVDDAFVIAGVEMGATHVHVVITDLRGRVRAEHNRPQAVVDEPASTLALIRKLIDRSLGQLDVPRSRLLGIGVGVPCPVDLKEPERLHPRIMPRWDGVSIVDTLIDAYGCPVYVDNDANLGAVAERWWGAGRDGEDLTYIKIATGVGAGHIIAGELYRGSGGTAGEIGHTAIDPRGPSCKCGLSGCLGAMIGSQQLVARARELARSGRAHAGPPSERTTIDGLVAAALDGDALAKKVVLEAGQYLGIAVANLLNLLNPAIVVIGGNLAAAGDLLLEPIRDTIQHRSLWKSVAEARIVTSELGDAAIAVGAATLVLKAALEDRSQFPARSAAQAV